MFRNESTAKLVAQFLAQKELNKSKFNLTIENLRDHLPPPNQIQDNYFILANSEIGTQLGKLSNNGGTERRKLDEIGIISCRANNSYNYEVVINRELYSYWYNNREVQTNTVNNVANKATIINIESDIPPAQTSTSLTLVEEEERQILSYLYEDEKIMPAEIDAKLLESCKKQQEKMENLFVSQFFV